MRLVPGVVPSPCCTYLEYGASPTCDKGFINRYRSGVFIRWNGTMEWNGEMERWNGMVE